VSVQLSSLPNSVQSTSVKRYIIYIRCLFLTLTTIGATCFTGSGEGTLFTWSGSSGTEVKGAKHDGKVQSLIYNSETKTLLSGGMDGKILKWTVAGSQLKAAGVLFDMAT
jgi:WD40 repeat protein